MKLLARHPVATIVIAQLLGTSLWFSPNSAADDLVRAWSLSTAQLGQLTSAVQIGFILGTLLLAISGLADRFRASRIFLVSCLSGAVFNAAFALAPVSFHQALLLRLAVGVCLAGIYPLGMKMVISWSRANASQTLALLVAMLTLGTALPHGVRAMGGAWSWQAVVVTSSVLALTSGIVIAILGDGPFLARAEGGKRPSWGEAILVFRDRTFRSSAIGYFGHMWELYAFWTAVPFLAAGALRPTGAVPWQVSACAYAIIASGALGCVLAGQMTQRFGSAPVAAIALLISGTMCLAYPFIAVHAGVAWSIVALLIWGMAVIADSAQFSAISARACPPHLVGSAFAIQNSIGFLVTVLPISLVTGQIEQLGVNVAWLLAPGPLVGLLFFRPVLRATLHAN